MKHLLTACLVACTLLAQANPASKKSSKSKRSTPKNIIFMVGDGMGVSQVYAGMVASKVPLAIESTRIVGFHKTHSADKFITDSAAGGTAFAIGKKTKNGVVGMDADLKPSETILEMAEKNGLSTGLVVTSSLTDATPSAFIAHQPKRGMSEEIAADYLKTDIDVFMGGGLNAFNKRKDGQDLTKKLKENNYTVAYSTEEIEKVNSGKLAAFIAPDSPTRYSEGRGNYLPMASKKAIDLLSSNKKGFFLMVEGSQIDWGGHANDTDYIVNEMLDFDRAIGQVLEFAKKDGNTLVVITADHETGGLSLAGGDVAEGKVVGGFTSKSHTAVMVPVFAYGPGADEFIGFYENTDIFHKMKKLFKFKN